MEKNENKCGSPVVVYFNRVTVFKFSAVSLNFC